MSAGALPNLVIIGAAKAGTTSLHNYLALHPDVFMSAQKELKLFDRPDWRDRVAWYRAQFATDAPVRGESSPTYSCNPIFGPVPQRMAELIPETRLIYLVRDPVERLIAQWVQLVEVLYERRSFSEAMRDFDRPTNVYVMGSRYAFQLNCFREYFPDRQILVVDQRELLERRAETMRRVLAFLEVAGRLADADLQPLHNTHEDKFWLNRTGTWLVDRQLFKPLRARTSRLPPGLRRVLKSSVTRAVVAPTLDDSLAAQLRSHLRADADALREYTGMPLAHWSV